jgi:hypothetical protein
MANSVDHSMTQMIQALSSLPLSHEQLQHALQSPERTMELMKRLSLDADPRCAESEIDIKQELAAAEARWQEEARLPPQKPLLAKRIDRESTNLAIAQEMSSTKFVSLKTFIGQEKKFSTIPISQLKIGTY